MKRILITGKNSYVGTSLENWLVKNYKIYSVHLISLRNDLWRKTDFSQYDVVIHLAAVVHMKENSEMETMYFKVNRDLAVEVANRAKIAGVKQFIFMSTMAVYGEEGKIGEEIIITRETKTNPKTFYGKSKLEAEYELQKMAYENFKVVILRPPMIYGRNCPGNYSKLEKMALKIPIFPFIDNKRSMLHVEKLNILIEEIIKNEVGGIFLPQDDEYVTTSLLVKKIAEQNGKKIYLSHFMGCVIKIVAKRNNLFNKVFGNLVYEK
ncbi:NAD-dependent epimerase/dehydratase family protein [Mesobacillus selenatarsenatis]|uniref:NAD-dependent epimerase/dehydratase family protein n=1 Tax=Mesobacillus selenatarsenatis TaxID=388741 RepID=A0A846TGZ8_9BACI|nr:NAD-dependent epimerase/dehydratase family protein [Mesobacillus selenatarsenatis]NKE04702.1 NAD-dependent epimerase/dehydratase family protein [Mesobacillus selenatarsenatis]